MLLAFLLASCTTNLTPEVKVKTAETGSGLLDPFAHSDDSGGTGEDASSDDGSADGSDSADDSGDSGGDDLSDDSGGSDDLSDAGGDGEDLGGGEDSGDSSGDSSGDDSGGSDPGYRQVDFAVIENPSGILGIDFGQSVAVLDYNGDSENDIAVGAPEANGGHGLVYVFMGPTFETFETINPTYGGGQTAQSGDRFGEALARAGEVDADPGEEILIGVPGKNVNENNDAGVVQLASFAKAEQLTYTAGHYISEDAEFGSSIAIGDLGGEEGLEVIVGAAKEQGVSLGGDDDNDDVQGQGAVYVFHILDPVSPARIPNPSTSGEANNGRFGDSVAVYKDTSGTFHSLAISAPNNPVDSINNAGSVYLFENPLSNSSPQATLANPLLGEENNNSIRFGDALASTPGRIGVGARNQDLLVDGSGSELKKNTGAGLIFFGNSFDVAETQVCKRSDILDEVLKNNDHTGENVIFAEVAGETSATSEFLVASPGSSGNEPLVMVYSGDLPEVEPQKVSMPAGATDKFANGMDRGRLGASTSKESVVLGDPQFNGGLGRIIILHFVESAP